MYFLIQAMGDVKGGTVVSLPDSMKAVELQIVFFLSNNLRLSQSLSLFVYFLLVSGFGFLSPQGTMLTSAQYLNKTILLRGVPYPYLKGLIFYC